jgi:hypothetical protein
LETLSLAKSDAAEQKATATFLGLDFPKTRKALAAAQFDQH